MGGGAARATAGQQAGQQATAFVPRRGHSGSRIGGPPRSG